MFDRFDIWKYQDSANCWDYVREFLIERAGVPEEDVPKYGISPDDKHSMTSASKDVEKSFIECGPLQNSVACHYHGNTIIHVGVVDGPYVRHTSRQRGTLKTKIPEFERMCSKTIYKIHRSLWQP